MLYAMSEHQTNVVFYCTECVCVLCAFQQLKRIVEQIQNQHNFTFIYFCFGDRRMGWNTLHG